MIGTCRDKEDYKLLEELRLKALDLGILDSVEFFVNKGRDDLIKIF